MRILVTTLSAALWLTALAWLAMLIYNIVALARAPRLPRSHRSRGTEEEGPLVSILVPARNEASRLLVPSIESMLAQQYGTFEIVAVDDRSTDETLAVLKGLARADRRLAAIEGEPVPTGWLGKPWALEQARRAARGDWLLATDADVVLHPAALKAAVDLALGEGYDAVTLVPDFTSNSFWARLVMPVAGSLINLTYPCWKVNDPRSRIAIGIGGFFLMRRTALDAIGGYEAIKAEVIDDIKTARLLKESGFKLHIAVAPSLVRTPMYANLAELFAGFGKNAFAGFGFRPARACLGALGNLSLTIGPLLMLALSFGSRDLAAVRTPSLIAYSLMVAAFLPAYVGTHTPVPYAVLSFLANAVLVAILLYSTWRVWSGRGAVWKSRILSLKTPEPASTHTHKEAQSGTGCAPSGPGDGCDKSGSRAQ